MKLNSVFTRLFIFLAFLSHSVMFSTWFFNVPEVSKRLGLQNDELGLALFFIPTGSLIGSYFASRLRIAQRSNLALLTLFFNVSFMSSALFPIFSVSFMMLCTALFFLGFSAAFLNVSMNSLALRYETSSTNRIVGKCHAVYSIGALVNLTTSSILAASNLNLSVYIGVLVVLVISIQAICLLKGKGIVLAEHDRVEVMTEGTSFKLKLLPLLFVAVITMLIEDALSNWSSLFLIREHSFSSQWAAAGLLIFNVFMLVGRLSVDALSEKMAAGKMLTYALLVISAGLVILISGINFVLLSFALMGLGCSIIVPTLYRQFNTISASGAALLTGAGSTAFLISPLIMGFVSNAFSLRISFVVILVLFGAALLMSKQVLSMFPARLK